MSKRKSPGNVKGEDSTGDVPEDQPPNRPRYQPIGASLGRGGRGGSSSASGNGDPFADDRGNIWEYLDDGIRSSSRPAGIGDSIRATRESDARADNHGEYLEVRMLDMESWQHRRGSNIADMPHTQSSLKSWSDIIDREWQRTLKAGRENRLTLANGQVKKHTCGSIWIDQHRLRMKRGGPVSSHEVYQRSYTKRGLVSEYTHTQARKGTKPGEPGSSGSPEFVDPMSKQRLEIRILKKQNEDLKTKMEDERAAAEAQRVADMQACHKTLNDRLESFAQNYPPRTAKSDPGPN